METIIEKINQAKIDINIINKAAVIIKNGGLVVFPTETVYGIGADALNEKACKRIFKAKGRPIDNPLIVHIANIEALDKLTYVTEEAKKLAAAFWPGPLTVILNKKDIISGAVTCNLSTVAIRMPSNKIALELIRDAGVPIAAPSANLSGRPSPTNAEHVTADLNGGVDMIIDGGSTEIGIESTVIDLSGDIPTILRPGSISLEEVRVILPNAEYENIRGNAAHKSPGTKYRHYAPKAKVILFDGDYEKLKEEAENTLLNGEKTGILVPCDFKNVKGAKMVKWETPTELAKILFKVLRDFDNEGIGVIYCILPDNKGIGNGIRNRLFKAAGCDNNEK